MPRRFYNNILHTETEIAKMTPEGNELAFGAKLTDPAHELLECGFQRLTYLQRIEIQKRVGGEVEKVLDGWQSRNGGLVVTLANEGMFMRFPEQPSISLRGRSLQGRLHYFSLKSVKIPERGEMDDDEYQLAIALIVDGEMRSIIAQWCRYFASMPKVLDYTDFDELWLKNERQKEENLVYFTHAK